MELQRCGEHLDSSQLKETIRFHSPDIVFLSETMNNVSVIDKIKRKIGYDHVVVIEPSGKFGGLAVFWKNSLSPDKIQFSECSIEIRLEDPNKGCKWWCICLYGSADEKKRKEQWKLLSSRKNLGVVILFVQVTLMI